MQNQKFYLVFFICLITIAIFAIKHSELNLLTNNTEFSDSTGFESASMSYDDTKKEEKITSNNKIQYASDAENIVVNPPTPLSGKTKSEIYRARKEFVKRSIFARANYEPSEDVFGGIESGKPWISANVCAQPDTGHLGITGPSEESRFINNPTMLVAIEYPFVVHYTDLKICEGSNSELIPTKITYSPSKKEITVTYYHLPFTTNNNSSFYMFNGVNARDLGYKYAYLDSSKSTYKVDFTNSDNLSTRVHEFQNFIHLGSSCGHEGGCNNGSPRQSFLEFKSNATEYNSKNKEIYIKLWKSMPKSPDAPADVTERIILKWS